MHIQVTSEAFRHSSAPIFFTDADYPPEPCHSSPLTVQLDISDQDVRKVLVDNGSSADIIFRNTLDRMILGEKEKVLPPEPTQGPLFGFGNHAIPVQGIIDIPTNQPQKNNHQTNPPLLERRCCHQNPISTNTLAMKKKKKKGNTVMKSL